VPTIASKTEGMRKLDGFVPLYWDEKAGKVWLEVQRFGEELLYYVSPPSCSLGRLRSKPKPAWRAC
jgi:hypothetical protein